jgi:hypothetical protein
VNKFLIRFLLTFGLLVAVGLTQIFSPVYFGVLGYQSQEAFPAEYHDHEAQAHFHSQSFGMQDSGIFPLQKDVSEFEIEEESASFPFHFSTFIDQGDYYRIELSLISDQLDFIRFNKNYFLTTPIRLHLMNCTLTI